MKKNHEKILENHFLNSNSTEIYRQKLLAFDKIKDSPLLPYSTRLSISGIEKSAVFKNILCNDVVLFNQHLTENNYNNDVLKSFQQIAAFFESKDIVLSLKEKHQCDIDENVLNMAILSGKYTGEKLKFYTDDCKPGYDSIKYAISSKNLSLLKELIEIYKVKPSPHHLVSAAAISDIGMFKYLLSMDVKPKGTLVFETASEYCEEIAQLLINEFNYKSSRVLN